jgi:cytochrome c-type biogenesis protein CcmH/NrfG
MIYKYKKDYSSAYNDFQHALKLSPDNPKIISHIKKISGYLNNKKK